MKIRIKYFAGLREAVGRGEEEFEVAGEECSVAAVRDQLVAGGVSALAELRNLRAAVNQSMAGPDAAVRDGDEVAFFPPVTGG